MRAWRPGLSAFFGGAAALIGILVIIGVAPLEGATVGAGLVLAGLAGLVP